MMEPLILTFPIMSSSVYKICGLVENTKDFIQRKNKMKAIVWSKDQCAFCEQAKSLLEMKGIEYEVRNISQDWTREQLLESVPTARSVPQIFLDDEYVGGFQELRQRLM